jgi:precorrin isomerase
MEVSDNGATGVRQVAIENDGVTTVEADSVVMTQSAAREVRAREARLDESAVVVVEATTASLANSACVQVLAESATVVSTPVFFVGAERATLSNSPVFLFLGRTDGAPVQATLDWRSALGLGAAGGVALALASALLGRLRRGR